MNDKMMMAIANVNPCRRPTRTNRVSHVLTSALKIAVGRLCLCFFWVSATSRWTGALLVVEAKELVATNEWQRLGPGDTLPAGLEIRVDLSTGEKLARLPQQPLDSGVDKRQLGNSDNRHHHRCSRSCHERQRERAEKRHLRGGRGGVTAAAAGADFSDHNNNNTTTIGEKDRHDEASIMSSEATLATTSGNMKIFFFLLFLSILVIWYRVRAHATSKSERWNS